MDNAMTIVDLTDEQLEIVSGGSYYNGVNINVATPININVSPTVNVALFSRNVTQSGASANLQNFSWQHIR